MSLSCEDVRESYSALLDNEVDLEYREVLELHLSGCSDCLRALAKFKSVTDLYRAIPAPDAAIDFTTEVCNRIDAPELPAAKAARAYYSAAALALLATAGLCCALWYWLG